MKKNTIYQIDTDHGFITVSKKEYFYTKERITNDECPMDEIRINGSLKQYSYWYEEVDDTCPIETRIFGYKRIVRCGTIETPEILSKFEEELVNNKNNYREVIKLVEAFLNSH